MNIQAADILSLFPGFDSLENLQQTLAADGTLPSSFSEALMAELQRLQDAVSANKDFLPDSGVSEAGFFANTGNFLPSDGNINLEQTLTALSDIMGRLEAIQQSELSNQKATGSDVNATNAEQLPIAEGLQEADKFQALGDLQSATYLNAPVQPAQTIVAELQQTLENDPFQKALTSSAAKTELTQMQDAVQSLLQQQNSRQQTVLMDTATAPARDVDIKLQVAEDLTRSEQLVLDKNQALFSDEIKQNASLNANPSGAMIDELGVEQKIKNRQKGIDNKAVLSSLAHLQRAVVPTQDTRNSLPVVQTAIGHPQWGQEFAEKIVWLHQKAIPSAEINLNPRHLGPVSIHIDVDKDQTSVSFQAHNPLVRESIEAALPRLREMLAAQQLNLVDVNVSQQQSEQKQSSHGFEQQTGQDDNKNAADSNSPHEAVADSAAAVMDEIEAGRAMVSQGMLSLFA